MNDTDGGWWIRALMAALVGVWACDGLPTAPVIDEPLILGIITEIDTIRDPMRILVEENSEVDEPLELGGSKIWFTVVEETALFDTRGDTVVRISVSDLAVNDSVAAVASGVILDSYPQQATADTVVIVQ